MRTSRDRIVVENPPSQEEMLLQTLEQLVAAFDQAGDEENKRKMADLARKCRDHTFVLAFCGHFSAGKSSMINALMGEKLLPTSPIPTSANVVTIEAGKAFAKAMLKGGDILEFASAEELSRIAEYCVNGETVESVAISHPCEHFPPGVQLMDTPGIDSTDDAHRVATESALHLADAILYVMDYNHVQAEANFAFTKMLKERQKPLFLVINQIDKHHDWELPFADFQSRVREGFAHWNIAVDGIFFTTLVDPGHPHNQLGELSALIQRLFASKEVLLLHNVYQTARVLVQEHARWLQRQQESRRRQLEERLAEVDDRAAALQRLEHVQREWAQLRERPQQLAEELRRELLSLIDHAILTPYAIVERARHYLQSRRPGFRAGWLFAGKKTEAERERRLQALYEELRERTSSQLIWHMKELFTKIPERYLSLPESYVQQVYALDVSFTTNLLRDLVKEGALSAVDDYVHNYVKDLAGEIRSLCRRQGLALLEQAVQHCQQEVQREEPAWREEWERLNRVAEAQRELARLDEEVADAVQPLNHLLEHVKAGGAWAEELAALKGNGGKGASSLFASIVSSSPGEAALLSPSSGTSALGEERKPEGKGKAIALSLGSIETVKNEPAAEGKYQDKLRQASLRLSRAADLLSSTPGMQKLVQAMRQRAERLAHSRFTVALFGAFSAGKSSFANALMGARVLPVSPHPTTAAINKILPPSDIYPHGTVRILCKSATDMLEDVRQSLAHFSLMANDLAEAVERVDRLEGRDVLPGLKPHLAFLRAMARGWKEMSPHLGKELRVDVKSFPSFVAQEEKACFVEGIELYYDCPLTRQGITLVDTPGADSINARHTGVAFEYIKNADAVLFVTYYNHAFSFADQEFLRQLGRVKDTFALDKMFFIVNAADLAHSKDELVGVVEHVRKNLIACGISQPRIYPLSSQTALLARLNEKRLLGAAEEALYRKRLGLTVGEPLPPGTVGLQQSGFAAFEKDFFAFTLGELTAIALKEAEGEVERARTAVEELVTLAKEAAEVRQARLTQIEEEKNRLRKAWAEGETSAEERALEKEIDELLYYVKQRLFLRLSDFFKESFNPAVLREDGRNLKEVLLVCLDEWLHLIGFYLAQEMRATSLRSERALGLNMQHWHEKTTSIVQSLWPSCRLSAPAPSPLPTPSFAESLPVKREDLIPSLRLFKNAKDFFERGGREKMQEDLAQRLEPAVSHYLQEEGQVLKEQIIEALQREKKTYRMNVEAEVEEYARGMKAALSLQSDPQSLAEVRDALLALQVSTMHP